MSQYSNEKRQIIIIKQRERGWEERKDGKKKRKKGNQLAITAKIKT